MKNRKLLATRYSLLARKDAFSLLELLIYMGLLTIVLLAITGIFLGIGSGKGKSETRSAVNANLRFALQDIENDLKAATTVTTPASAGATSTTLTFNASGTISYCIASSTLYRQAGGTCSATSTAITDATVTVTSAVFTRLENTNTLLNKTVVSIVNDLTMTSAVTAPEGQYSEEKIETVALRN